MCFLVQEVVKRCYSYTDYNKDCLDVKICAFLTHYVDIVDSMCYTINNKEWWMETIKIKIKKVYGEYKIYPVCEKGKVFCELLKQKTFTQNNINKIKDLGFSFEEVADTSHKIDL